MHLLSRRIRNLILGWWTGIFFFFLSFLYADNNMVGFSEFMFLSWGIEVDTLHLTMTGGDTTGLSVTIYNKEDISMTYKLWFVDAWITNDLFAQKACLSDNEIWSFWKYISGDTSFFTLSAHSSTTKTLSIKFPEFYSWIYHGCVMFYPILTPLNTNPGNTSGMAFDRHTLPRRGGFIDAYVTPLTSNFTLTVRPAFRPTNTTTWYSLYNADFWIFVYDNGAWTWRYNSAKDLWDPKVSTDKDGLGVVSFVPPADGTLYLMAFKGSGTLSLWFTGIRDNTITWFNFFSWGLADSLDNEFMFTYYNWWITGHYLKVGDLITYNSWTYDFIKDPDFAIMTNNLSLSSNILHPYRFDLDINNVINALEQTMLLDSYNRIWFIASQNMVSITDFVNF